MNNDVTHCRKFVQIATNVIRSRWHYSEGLKQAREPTYSRLKGCAEFTLKNAHKKAHPVFPAKVFILRYAHANPIQVGDCEPTGRLIRSIRSSAGPTRWAEKTLRC